MGPKQHLRLLVAGKNPLKLTGEGFMLVDWSGRSGRDRINMEKYRKESKRGECGSTDEANSGV